MQPATPLFAPGTRRPALPSLTGARWYAALAVFILHCVIFLPVYPFQRTEAFVTLHKAIPMQLGSLGVTFFFLLSGFIIYYSSRSDDTPLLFYRRRILKIFPTHWLSTLILMALVAVPFGRLITWLPEVLLVHTWNPQSTYLGALNVPAWSLCSEMLFYFSFPLLKPLVEKLRTNKQLLIAFASILVTLVVMHVCFYLLADGPKGIHNAFSVRILDTTTSPFYPANSDPSWFQREHIAYYPSYWLSYYFPLARFGEFWLGVLACKLVLSGWWRNTKIWWPALLLAASYAATWFVPINFKMSVLFLLPTALCIATLARRDVEGKTVFLGSKANVWLGNVSFAFYMVQYPVMVWVTRTFIGGKSYGWAGWLGFSVLAFVVSVVVSGLVYTYVDKPIMKNWARPKAGSKAPAQAQQPSAK
ncbi:MAG: acyltransferase [Lawsonella sp.]|uniref:acyltransferase family protein n=1 Tax=Lawsonella sp. TaxID=2041415 RepID=UPI002A74F5AB|nr:acyltransferase [Lawsonella sp.]MDY2978646.1 acyltransferase [Lawsonella sp.]